MSELWRTLQGNRPRFALIVVIEAILGGTEALLHPLLIKAIFDQAVLAGDFGRFLALGAFYLLLGLAINLGAYANSWWRKRFENSFVLSLEMELLDRTLGLDSRQMATAGNASYVSRIHNDVREGVLPAIDVSVRVAKQVIASVVFVGVLLYLSWQASLILLVIVPPLVFVSNRIAKRIGENTEPEREAEARYINKLTRTLEAVRAVRGLPLLLPGARQVNRTALSGFLDITFVNHRLNLRQRTLSDLTMNLSDTAAMVVGAFFVFAGRMSFGGFLAFVNSLWRAVTGILTVINTIPQFRRNAAVLRRIHTLRGFTAAPYHERGPMVLLHGVRVSYDAGTRVSIEAFELHPGEHVLLRGPNGCGKTTLLQIVAGTLAPDAGLVTLPPRVASLTAPVHLPPLPVRDLVPDEGLRVSMGVDGLNDQLPTRLSSGQRQKVGIAALLCEDADVYLVDEPFANLDDEARELALRELTERTRGRGLLMVLHGDEELDDRFDRVVTLSGAGARR
ncbi:lipid A export ATP-binding/permease protein MsbA [Micromonospora qiuiae]|uniref:Lipid A export ATP-binding/permease protein MsbA n=1 Tax=Micromonospora qiuiae TaxID=502268 RepID=A0ABQ4JK39_9ACTN|nr:ABC transporter ATP-binding protein [Micromonospora qiuiae]GIJ29891.1 lipid A export ATP-binding/permease protein MsbA [Micromonospora qiuiae]